MTMRLVILRRLPHQFDAHTANGKLLVAARPVSSRAVSAPPSAICPAKLTASLMSRDGKTSRIATGWSPRYARRERQADAAARVDVSTSSLVRWRRARATASRQGEIIVFAARTRVNHLLDAFDAACHRVPVHAAVARRGRPLWPTASSAARSPRTYIALRLARCVSSAERDSWRSSGERIADRLQRHPVVFGGNQSAVCPRSAG